MPLHIDYRPKDFDEIVGNEPIIESLNSILGREDKPHAYMFNGPKGCGKTTFARILARKLGADEMEIHEYDTSNVRGIEEIQNIKQQSFYAPLSGTVRVNIFDEAHEITKKGAEAMLKFLEDSPAHIYNILCTTNPEKIPSTVMRRCACYTVQSLRMNEMKAVLGWVLKSENVILHEEVGNKLVKAAHGCPGIMLVKLDQIIDIKDKDKQLLAIEEVSDENPQIIDICRSLMAREKGSVRWTALSKILSNFDQDPEQTRRAILGYLNKVLLGYKFEDGKRIAEMMTWFQGNYYDSGKSGLITSCFMSCLN